MRAAIVGGHKLTTRIVQLVAVLVFALPATAAHAAVTIVDVGPGYNWDAVNEAGQLAGWVLHGNAYQAARWETGVATALGTDGTSGHAIAEDGTVLGMIDGHDAAYPAWWDASGQHTAEVSYLGGGEGGGFRDVSHNGTAAIAVNTTLNSGDGHYYGGDVVPTPFQTVVTSARPIRDGTAVRSVNDAGHALTSQALSPYAPLFWDGVNSYPVGIGGGQPHSLNDADTFVGRTITQPLHAAEQTGAFGPVVPLPDPLGAMSGTSIPVAINTQGVVVGSSSAGAVIWQPGGASVALLDSLLPTGSPWHLQSAVDISDSGYILGRGTLNGGPVHTFLILGRPQANITGSVRRRDNTAAVGTTLTLTGTDDSGAALSQTTAADFDGAYAFKVPLGTYSVRASGDPVAELGGASTASLCPGKATDDTCALGHLDGTASTVADFTYTECGAANDLPADQQPTGCPIIFVPGILGSVIQCSGDWLWPKLPHSYFSHMALRPDGFTNAGAPGSCNANATTLPGFEGVVQSVAGQDAYGTALDFISKIVPGRAYAYPYDWRTGVERSITGLDVTIKQALKDSGAQKVVLWAHSMGGLVSRYYIDDQARAKNVARLITVGTPYNGAPKSVFALLEGDTDTPAGGAMDLLVNSSDLQLAARNYEGLFWLYPSAMYPSWLKVDGQELNEQGVEKFAASLGATPALLAKAQAGHREIDGFRTNGVDYTAVIGTGVPTIKHLSLMTGLGGVLSVGVAAIGNGDGTVPRVSQAQGAVDGAASNGIPLHYMCGIGHGSETGSVGLQQRIKGFLLTGADLPGAEGLCSDAGTVYKYYDTNAVVHASAVAKASSGLTPAQAKQAGLADVTTLGQTTLIVTDANHPVSIAVPLNGAALTAQTFNGERMGTAHTFEATAGTVTLDQTGRVTAKGKVLKPGRADAKAPKTVATVRRHGKRIVVTLKAHDSGTGVAATWTRLGKAKAKKYRRPLTLSAAQLKRMRFSSIDRAGNVEVSRRAR